MIVETIDHEVEVEKKKQGAKRQPDHVELRLEILWLKVEKTKVLVEYVIDHVFAQIGIVEVDLNESVLQTE